ncbi:MAG TPA: hypothetical protein VKP58_10085 [Candidatus Acidoferrum sp.]|nr:hypothetical protein [Candidatus Acidoferrum sp.]
MNWKMKTGGASQFVRAQDGAAVSVKRRITVQFEPPNVQKV